ncbi:MAG TPA: hypothetical protein VFU35_06625 [Jatrophihabitans sp.]|nr:hypothetical protein [Jatrophihabitans sp.]
MAHPTRPEDDRLRQIKTMRFQGAANVIVRGLLRTPLLCRGVGRRLITIYVVGRKTGKRYAVPTAYTRRGDTLLIGTPFRWARNLRTGESVEIRLRGKRRTADVTVIADQDGVVERYAVIARDNHQFARFNKIELDPAGNPNRADLLRAWSAGARAIEFRVPH